MLPIALMALSGLGVLLSAETLRRMGTVKGRSDAVLGGPNARVFGFPNATLALVYFVLVFAFAALRLAGMLVPVWPALGAAALSVVMSIYLATRLMRLHRF